VVSDICDGVVQATDGMSYSLISRDIMAAMIEDPRAPAIRTTRWC
jgi:dihydroxyacid dehydratase/phosphogluconate dehydratase